MKLKRFLSVALALGMVFSAMTVSSAFADDSELQFVVGTPINISTGEAETEFKAGDIIEVPIDVVNVPSGALSMMQFSMYYDNTIFESGASAASALSYYNSYSSYIAISNGKMVGRHNMKYDSLGIGVQLAVGTFSGNISAGDDEVTMLWTINDTTSIPINENDPEVYLLFTVKQDFDADDFSLNYSGSQSYTGSGLFALKGTKVDETTSTSHSDITGTQYNKKLNACDGAFQVVVNIEDLKDNIDDDSYYNIQRIYAVVDGVEGETNLTACVDEDNNIPTDSYVSSGTYYFPVRLTSEDEVDNVKVTIYAEVSTDKNGNTTNTTTYNWGTVIVDMSGTVTAYDNNINSGSISAPGYVDTNVDTE